jgi:glycosyltransferase involved in cell wall biosynthesis
MLVSLDAIPLASRLTGVGHYTLELARHLALASAADQFELVSPFPFAAQIADEQNFPGNLSLVRAQVSPLGRRWFSVGLPLYARRERVDLFHGTNYEVPLWGTTPSVLTVHDLSLLLHPSTHEARLVRRGRRRLPLMASAASLIITPSESVRAELTEHLGVAPSKIIAIPEAPREVFRPAPAGEALEVRQRLGVEDEFVLFVGTVEPRKNLTTLVAAFAEVLGSTALRPQLVIAGGEGWLTNDLHEQVEKSGVKDRLRFTGYVTDEDLSALYSSCRVFVYPSLYEGFGLPPLEAMACGAPVVASHVPSVMEAAGRDAARVVNPMDVGGLARELVHLLSDENERRHLSALGRERASQFTWERTARATLEVYKEALRRKASRWRRKVKT